LARRQRDAVEFLERITYGLVTTETDVFKKGTNGRAQASIEDVVEAAVAEGFLVGIGHGRPCLAAKDCGHIEKSTCGR